MKARNLFAPVENIHAVRRGEKYAMRYTDKYGVRSDKFVPEQKIAAPRFTWDYDLTDENAAFMRSTALESSKELTGNSPFNDEQWPLHSWTPGAMCVVTVLSPHCSIFFQILVLWVFGNCHSC